MSALPNPKLIMWDTWFVFSGILLMSTIFIGMTDNSKIIYPNYPIFFGIVVINMFVCMCTGLMYKKL